MADLKHGGGCEGDLLVISENEYDKMCDEFNIWFSETGCDREYRSDSDVERMLHGYVTEQVKTDNWVVL